MECHPLAHARGESIQAPTTNLSSNDPWRDPESPQTPETSRHVLERKKPSGAQGDTGKHRSWCVHHDHDHVTYRVMWYQGDERIESRRLMGFLRHMIRGR